LLLVYSKGGADGGNVGIFLVPGDGGSPVKPIQNHMHVTIGFHGKPPLVFSYYTPPEKFVKIHIQQGKKMSETGCSPS
jgi:hypothetical protein